MTGRIAIPPVAEYRSRRSLPLGAVSRLLDTLEKPLIVAERSYQANAKSVTTFDEVTQATLNLKP